MKKSYENKNLSILPKWAQDYIQALQQEVDQLQAIEEMHAIFTEKDRYWFTLPGPEEHSDREVIKLWIFNRDDPLQVAALYPGDKLFIGRRREVEYGSEGPQETKEQGSLPGKDETGTVLQRGGSARNGKRARSKK